MNEVEFIDSFDCKFPYHDKAAWTGIIHESCKISANAAFAVLHEICRPPNSAQVSSSQLREIAEYWVRKVNFPLAHEVSKVAYRMIDNDSISVVDAMETMNLVAQHKNQYSALAIVYFSCNDAEGKADSTYEAIVSSWRDLI